MKRKTENADVAGGEVWDVEMCEIRRLEESVLRAEGDGLRARWESGKYLVSLRQGGKKLPPGMLSRLTEEFQVHPSELTARMKFASKFETEEAFTNVISEWRTWFVIKQYALTDKPRVQEGTLNVADDEGEDVSGRDDIDGNDGGDDDGDGDDETDDRIRRCLNRVIADGSHDEENHARHDEESCDVQRGS